MGDTKRKMLTPQERAAKLERELAEARAKAEAADRKQHDQLQEQRAKLQAQVDERIAKIEMIDAALLKILERTPALAESKPALSVVEDVESEAAAV